MNAVIQVDQLSKHYRLGVIGSATFREDVNRWWARFRGRPDPGGKVDQYERNPTHSEIWALREINLQVEQGEILGIIGRNGAGKSTLLKILSRITAPSSGRAVIRGRVGSLLEIGTGFHPELTGRENIYLNGAILGMTRTEIRRKLDEIVDFARVEAFLDTPVKRYSSGMAVRLAFAVAAHLEPEILIVDEVLAVGDADFQKRCLGRMHDIAKSGRTVLFVSHNMNSVTSLCNTGIWIDDGRIRNAGAVNSVVNQYLAETSNKAAEWKKTSTGNDKGESLSSLELLDGREQVSGAFAHNEPVFVRIGYQSELKPSEFVLTLTVADLLGNELFTSWDRDTETCRKDSRGTLIAQVPANLLKPGVYQMTVAIYDLSSGWINKGEEYTSSFEITTLGFPGAGRRYGLVFPKVEWTRLTRISN